jgi:hypothetical protein
MSLLATILASRELARGRGDSGAAVRAATNNRDSTYGAAMSFRAIYKCDICRDDTDKQYVVGVCFSGLKNFKLKSPETTQGTHICLGCLHQIHQQADAVLHALPAPAEQE